MHDSDGNVQLSERDEKLHQGIVSLSFCPPNPQKVRHLYEVGQRLRSHFSCDLTPMHLHRNLGDTDFRRDLLVQEAARDPRHDFLFPWRQCVEFRA